MEDEDVLISPASSNEDTMIEIYGKMVSDSLKIDSAPLNKCLDDILALFNSYFILIQKVCFSLKKKTRFNNKKNAVFICDLV
jgi:hypothetical protein